MHDQIGSPTSATDLAARCVKMLTAEKLPNILHCAGEEPMSWFHFAKLIEKLYLDDSKPMQVKPCLSAEYVTKARPKDTRLLLLNYLIIFLNRKSIANYLSVINLIKATKDK